MLADASRVSSLIQATCATHAVAGTVSVWAGELTGVAFCERDADAQHYAASTMKLPLVVAAQRCIVRGELEPAQQVVVHNEFASTADGSAFSLDPADDQDPVTWSALGSTRSLGQLAESAVIHSGNLATNLLLDLVGVAEVAEVLRLAGCSPATVVARGIEDVAARGAGLNNLVTARDLGVLMAAIARRDDALGGPAVCEPVEQVLARQTYRNQIPAGLPPGTYTASKSGWVNGLSHDVAVVRPADRDPFVLAVCTTTGLDEQPGAALVAAIAQSVWQGITA